MASFDEVVAGMDEGQRLAIIRKVVRAAKNGDETVAEQVLRDVATGDLRIMLVDGIVKFFDQHGRRIPSEGMTNPVMDANSAFRLIQPPSDYLGRYARMADGFGGGLVPAPEFQTRCDAVLVRLAVDKQTANLLKGVYLPICLPSASGDYGTVLEEKFLAAVKRSYEAQFPDRKFYNHRAGTLANQVTVIAGTRHEQLVAALQTGPAVGIYFPQALQGFSILADREQMSSLPEHIFVAGAFEASVALVGYPDVLARDYQTTCLDCAATQWQSPEYSLYFFRGLGGGLGFGRRDLGVDVSCSGGLFVRAP